MTAAFFLDRGLGRKDVATALKNAGAEVILHDDRFDGRTPDAVWLAEAGAQGWVVLTRDLGIRTSRLEREAIARANVAVFALSRSDLRGPEMAAIFMQALPRMRTFLARYSAPFIATISVAGVVRMTHEGKVLRRLIREA